MNKRIQERFSRWEPRILAAERVAMEQRELQKMKRCHLMRMRLWHSVVNGLEWQAAREWGPRAEVCGNTDTDDTQRN